MGGCRIKPTREYGLANWRWSVQDVVDELEDKVFRTFRTFLGGIAREDSPTS
jgi:hypothetical protein